MATQRQSIRKIELGDKKFTITQLRDLCKALQEENDFLKTSAQCPVCGRHLPEQKFYKNGDPNFKSGKIIICKDCLKKILCRVDENNEEHEPTKESLIKALQFMNRPFIKSIYEDSLKEEKSKRNSANFASIYMRNISNKIYNGLTFADSDMFKIKTIYSDEYHSSEDEEIVEEREQIKKDRDDLIRMIGYDPFSKEDPADQPFLYSQALGMLDSNSDSDDDQMKIQSIISIVRSFLQISKIDDSLTLMMSDMNAMKMNAGDIQKLQDSKTKIQSGITKLASESCISLKNAKGSTKGDNSWTGKIKKCKDLSLRSAENNGFDLNTCRGMEQVMDISHRSILRQLKLDESEYSDMLAEQRDLLVKAQKERDKANEVSRVLLRENLDLKDLLFENNISIVKDLVNLDELLTSYDHEDGDKDG